MGKKLILLVLFLFFIFNSILIVWYFLPIDFVGSTSGKRTTGIVSKVIDGDTVIVNGESVRLLGIDSDEKGYPCFTPAKKQIESLILSKEVELEKDKEDLDMYKRQLRYIFLDGENINLKMVRTGFAVARFGSSDQKYKSEILEAQNYALENKLGCKWSSI
jgi:micrococcal nuclease